MVEYLFRIFQQKTLVVLLFFSAISIVLLIFAYLYIESNQTVANIYLSIGSSFLAATVFSIVYNYYTYKESSEILHSQLEPLNKSSSSIENNINLIGDQLNQLINSSSRLESSVKDVISNMGNIPKEIYLGSNEFRVSFNDSFIQSLAISDFYYFRGATGRYAVSRIIDREGLLDSLKMILPNPINPVSFALRQSHNNLLDISSKRLDKIDDNIVTEMLVSLYGLFVFASPKIKRISIGFTNEPFLDRLEITNSDIYVQMFDNSVLGKFNYPKIYQFGKHSVIYEYSYRGFNEFLSTDSSSNYHYSSIDLNRNFPDNLKEYFVKALTINNLTINDPEIYAEKFRKFHNNIYVPSCRNSRII